MIINQCNTQEKTLIIAEIGNNHEGNFSVAQDMVRRAADCGVDAVKFQTFNTDHYVRRQDTERHKRLTQFELTHNEFSQLAELSRSLNMLFISTPFDLGSATFLAEIVDAFKIASGDITFIPLIRRVAQFSQPVILSTGASTIDQIQTALDVVTAQKENCSLQDVVAILHCVVSYPAPPEAVHLRAIQVLKNRFHVTVGLSDHTEGAEACTLSTAMGAQIIEKHFTLDKNYSDFRDHQLSADPPEMKQLVESVRRAELLLGKEEKVMQSCEEQIVEAVRRSVAAGRDIPKGTVLTENDFTWIRPATGLAPGTEDQLIGKTVNRDLTFGDFISFDDVIES